MKIECSAHAMVVELLEHEVTRKLQRLCRVQSSAFNSDRRLIRSRCRQDPERVDQAMMIEMSVCDAGVQGIAKEIVRTIGSERVAGDDLRQELVPWREIIRISGPVLQANCNF